MKTYSPLNVFNDKSGEYTIIACKRDNTSGIFNLLTVKDTFNKKDGEKEEYYVISVIPENDDEANENNILNVTWNEYQIFPMIVGDLCFFLRG